MKKLLGLIVAFSLVYTVNPQESKAGGGGGVSGLVGRIIGGGGHGFNQGFRQNNRVVFLGGGHGYNQRFVSSYSLGLGGGCGVSAYSLGLGGGCGGGVIAPPVVVGGGSAYYSAGYAAPIYAPPMYQQPIYAPQYAAPPQQYAPPPSQSYTDFTALDERYVTKREFADFADDVYNKIDRLRQSQRRGDDRDTDIPPPPSNDDTDY